MSGSTPAPSSPAGLATALKGGSCRLPPANAVPTVVPITPTPVSQSTARQRRLGGLPSGNSTNSSGGMANRGGTNAHVATQAAQSAPGSAPGSTNSA